MPTALDFSELTEVANDAQARISESAEETRDALMARVQQAQRRAEQEALQLQAQVGQVKGKAAADWESLKSKWHAHLQDLHGKAEAKKAQMDQHKAEMRAESAELYADDAISFAIAAIQEAEYAVLDAALARSDADAMAG
jgi:hypothetical protein